MKQKNRRALLVSVQKEGKDLRICLDDVVSMGSETWTEDVHVTSKIVAGDAFDKMTFENKELADFGYYILARISAFVKRGEN